MENGARFIINQIGFDARKCHELLEYFRWRGLAQVPVIGNVYVLNGTVAELFHRLKIPGVVMTDELRELCLKQAASPDQGRAFFREFAAKQMAVFRGLGYRRRAIWAEFTATGRLRRFSTSNGLSRPMTGGSSPGRSGYSRPGEFFLFEEDPATGLCQAGSGQPRVGGIPRRRGSRIPT